MDIESVKKLEQDLTEQCQRLVSAQDVDGLGALILSLKDAQWVQDLSKIKVTKFLRLLLDALASVPHSLDTQARILADMVAWSKLHNRLYLKYYLETRQAALALAQGQYQESLALTQSLAKELRKLDDKMMLLELALLESRVHYALHNIPKSKASLTTARAIANAIYVPPVIQASLDLQSGMLHAEEKDYKTGFSYFYEAFEGFASIENPQAVLALKYMLLSKIMQGQSDDVTTLLQGKLGAKYAGRPLEAMQVVARAYQNRSLQEFEQALQSYQQELGKDVMIQSHLKTLYDALLEANLVKLVEPYSRVELSHLAGLIGLPVATVEAKLSQMILDGVLACSAMLDQGAGCLVLGAAPKEDATYPVLAKTLKQLDAVVDALYQKAALLA